MLWLITFLCYQPYNVFKVILITSRHCIKLNRICRFDQPNSFLAAMSFGNCGYAFPAAMGAKVALPNRPCLAFVGDGAWGMSLNEMLTCVRENIPVIAVVFNNGQWGAEKKNQVRGETVVARYKNYKSLPLIK